MPLEATASDSSPSPLQVAIAEAVHRLPPDRPLQVVRAVKGLWILFSATMVAYLAEHFSSGAWRSVFSTVILLMILALTAWFYAVIGKGRNWARILFMGFTALSILVAPFYVFMRIQAGAIGNLNLETVMAIFTNGISCYISYMLWTDPADRWFLEMSAWRARQSAANSPAEADAAE